MPTAPSGPYVRRACWVRPLALAGLVLVLGACVPQETTVRVNTVVKTNQSDPVDGAVVSIDGKELGVTDHRGHWSGDVPLAAGSRQKLAIRKDSDTYYFAPYHETFTVDDVGPQERTVAAVLYFVPKPTPEDSARLRAGKQAAETAPSTALEPPPSQRPPVESDLVPPAAGSTPVAAADVDLPPVTDVKALPAVDEPELVAVDPAADPTDVAHVGADASAPAVATEGPGGEASLPAVATVDAVASQDPNLGVLPAAEARPAPLMQTTDSPAAKELVQSLADEPAAPIATINPAASAMPAIPEPPSEPMLLQGKSAVFTLHAFAGANPLAGAAVSVAEEGADSLAESCVTNARGRCVVRFRDTPMKPVTFLVVKGGYKSVKTILPVKNKGMAKLNLERGQTVDVFAMTKSYNRSGGLKGVAVIVGKRKVADTDAFGHASYHYSGKAESLLPITLQPQGYLPERFDTDFVVGGPLTLTKFFTPAQAPAVRVALLPVRADDASVTPPALRQLDGQVRAALRRHLTASAAFREYPLPLFERAAQRAARPIAHMVANGWADTEIKAALDTVLVTTVSAGPDRAIELSLLDSRGRVVAAAKAPLPPGEALAAAVEPALTAGLAALVKRFPFEGVVLSVAKGAVAFNLGTTHGRALQPGDRLTVFGTQAEKSGRTQAHQRIASLLVRTVGNEQSTAVVTHQAPRSVIARGDLVLVRPRLEPAADAVTVAVATTGPAGAEPVAQANIYFGDVWAGATDQDGRLALPGGASGPLMIRKQGFAAYSEPVLPDPKAGVVAVRLKRERVSLRLESRPSSVVVKVSGQVVGKTPLTTALPDAGGVIAVELAGPSGYKPYHFTVDPRAGEADRTGPQLIVLEKDWRAVAQRHLKAGKPSDALATYAQIPKGHSDYLLGRHEAGELLLSLRNEPAAAAAAFAEVTTNPEVAAFKDLRFIGSHINEGIALFLTAEALVADQPAAAKAHYQRAVDVLERVVPHLRSVGPEQYGQAVHNVDYHRALARHKLWLMTKDPVMLTETLKTWRGYLDGSARSLPTDSTSKIYVEHAQAYFDQAQASAGRSRVSRQ